jgi:hypothetical protein
VRQIVDRLRGSAAIKQSINYLDADEEDQTLRVQQSNDLSFSTHIPVRKN